jgi:hypothetical protein
MAKIIPRFALAVEDSEGEDYTLTLAYCFEEREQPHKISGFLLLMTDSEQDDYSINACDDEWLIRESRGNLASVDHALLFAREHWEIPVRSWRIYGPTDFTNEAIRSYESGYRKAQRRAAELIWQFQGGDMLKRLKAGDAELRKLYEVLKEEQED